MRDRSATKAILYKLAERIEQIDVNSNKEKISYKDRAAIHLRQLGDAVDGGVEAPIWAKADIYRVINPDMIIAHYYGVTLAERIAQWLERGLEFFRNILIFFPIVVTWFGIAQATSAYYTLISVCQRKCPGSDPNLASQPFLYLWEHSFSNYLQPPWLTLSTIGWIDASILLTIIVLTVVVKLPGFFTQRREDRAQELYADLTAALSDASLCLYEQGPRHVQPIDNLDKVAGRIDDMSQQIILRFEGIAKTVEQKFEGMATSVIKQFDGVQEQFTNLSTTLSEQLGGIQQTVQKQQQEVDRHLNTLGQLMSSTGSIAQEINTAAGSIQQTNQEVKQNLSLLSTSVRELVQQQQTLLNTTHQSVEHLDEIATNLQKFNTQQRQWVDQFSETFDTLNIAIDKIDRMVAGMNDISKQQKTFLAGLEKEREAQGKLAERLENIAATHKEALDAIGSGAISLRQIVTTMNETLRLQASMSDTNVMDVKNIVQSYTKAAKAIEQSGQNLGESAIAIFNAGDALKSVVDTFKDVVNELEDKISG
jgi:methyl-accepting chemotaxis protein